MTSICACQLRICDGFESPISALRRIPRNITYAYEREMAGDGNKKRQRPVQKKIAGE